MLAHDNKAHQKSAAENRGFQSPLKPIGVNTVNSEQCIGRNGTEPMWIDDNADRKENIEGSQSEHHMVPGKKPQQHAKGNSDSFSALSFPEGGKGMAEYRRGNHRGKPPAGKI